MLNSTVVSLKVDPKSNNVIGTNDLGYDDQTFYDYVISTADVGAVQSILNTTYDNYNKAPAITQALIKCNNNSISQMKIAPDYRVKNKPIIRITIMKSIKCSFYIFYRSFVFGLTSK